MASDLIHESLALIVAPTEEPVSLAEAKSWLGLTGAERDGDVNFAIEAARDWLERETETQVMTATRELRLDEFPDVIRLPRPPVQSITSITYNDTDDASQTYTLADADQDLNGAIARIQPKSGNVWPSTIAGLNKVLVRYVCGYSSLTAVPASIRRAIQMFIATTFDHPVAQHEMRLTANDAFERLVAPHRVLRVG